MFNIEFYSTADGTSELWNFLDSLQQKSSKSKDARIQHKQIVMYIQLLEDHGTNLGDNVTRQNATTGFPERDDRYVYMGRL